MWVREVGGSTAAGPDVVLLTDWDACCVTGYCKAERIRQDIHVPSGQFGVRPVTSRAGFQTARGRCLQTRV